jgi:hypothetical protein
VKPDRESCEDRARVGAPVASERLVHMFKAALQGDPVARKQCKLGRAMGEALKGGKAVDRCKFADRVHLFVDVERRQASGSLVEVGNSVAELLSDMVERTCH